MDQAIAMGTCFIEFSQSEPWLYTLLAGEKPLDWETLSEEELHMTQDPIEMVKNCISRGAKQGEWRDDLN